MALQLPALGTALGDGVLFELNASFVTDPQEASIFLSNLDSSILQARSRDRIRLLRAHPIIPSWQLTRVWPEKTVAEGLHGRSLQVGNLHSWRR